MDIIYIIKTIVLGIVEGLTEFLPVSSTGHLIIASDLMNIESDAFNKMFMVVVQLAAILAVLVLYWPRIWKVLKSFFTGEKAGRHFMLIWVLGCVPAVVMALLFGDAIDEYLFSVPTVVVALAVGALLMLFGEEKVAKGNTIDDVGEITVKQSLIVGFAQCVSLWPGFSRSAATIMGGWAAGLTTSAAADYSFFLAIPIMFGASGYSLLKYFIDPTVAGTAAGSAFTSTQIVAFVLGCLVSFVVALVVVKAFLHFLKKKPLKYFAWYRLVLAAVLLVLMLTGVVKG